MRSSKSILAICGCSLSLLVSIAEAQIMINWGAVGAYSWLYDSTGVNYAPTDGLLIQCVVDVNGNTDFTQLMAGYIGLPGDGTSWTVDNTATDDVFGAWATGVWTYDGSATQYWSGGASSDVSPYNTQTNINANFYFRWFSATSVYWGAEAGVIYSTNGSWNLPFNMTTPPGGESLDFAYGTGNVGGSQYMPGVNDGWATVVPIPEPATFALFGLGLATMFVRRRFRK